jgi:microcystin-dependent protein
VLTSLPAFDGGVGYQAVPDYEIFNPDGTEITDVVLSFAAPSATTLTGATVTGGELSTPTITNGGTGIEAGAYIRIRTVTSADAQALVQLPNGYFRVPDMRGRVSLGSGLESKTAGIADPPDIAKGDLYTASSNAVGSVGGAQAAVGSHTHALFNDEDRSSISVVTTKAPVAVAAGTSQDESYTMTPAVDGLEPTVGRTAYAGSTDTRPPFFVLNKIIKAL